MTHTQQPDKETQKAQEGWQVFTKITTYSIVILAVILSFLVIVIV